MTNAKFIDFANQHGVNIEPSKLLSDGRIHRADVGDTASGKGDASYLLRENGSGWVTNFKTDGRPLYFRPEFARDLMPVELARIEAEREARRMKQVERQRQAVIESIGYWNQAHDAGNFPYLKDPALPAYGLRQVKGRLHVPMLAMDSDGEAAWVGMQRITWAEPGHSAEKRFVPGTPTKGAFSVIPIIGAEEEAPLAAFDAAKMARHVVLCEGVGTALAIHHATGLPVIAAMSAQNLPAVAHALRDHLLGDVVIYADNDGEKSLHKGQTCALQAARVLGQRAQIALPENPGGTPSGYDARDQLRDGGVQEIARTIGKAVEANAFEQRYSFQEDKPVIHQPKENSMEQAINPRTPEVRLLPAGGIEHARDPVTDVQSMEHPVDHPYLGAEYVLARLDLSGREALQVAREGIVLTDQQRDLLSGRGVYPSLIDAEGCLNEDGVNVYERMNAGMEEDRQLQQQLRTRNTDEGLEEKAQQQSEKKQEMIDRDFRKREQEQGMGL